MLIATALTYAMSNNAITAGTPSGTSVGNIATINYSVGGTAQPQVGATEGGNTLTTVTTTNSTIIAAVERSELYSSNNLAAF